MNAPTNDTNDTAPFDPERIAHRVNGSVAADFQALEIRSRYVRQRTSLDLDDLLRRLEAIEATLFELYDRIERPTTA